MWNVITLDGCFEGEKNWDLDFHTLVWGPELEKLSADQEAEQCGWLKDTFGVSWQIVPRAMDKMMSNGTPEQIARLTKAFLQMKKFNIKELEDAFNGK